MNEPRTTSLDDGQPLVEFAPLKPAEFASLPRLGADPARPQSEWKYVPVRRFG